VPAASLKPGDVILVKPGEQIPADGTVLRGQGSVNEAMLTGESLPVEKGPGSEVIGGSLSADGLLTVTVTRIGEDTTLSKIIRFVEDAQGKKAPIARTADRVAGIFVPAVMAIALAAAVIWLLLGRICLRPPDLHLRAGDRLPLRAGPGHPHRHHGGHRPGRLQRHFDPQRRGAGDYTQSPHRGHG
jgi:cation transport ATPase